MQFQENANKLSKKKRISRYINDGLEFFSDDFNVETSDESHKEASHESGEKDCNDEYHAQH